jgi:kynurenine formamidase
MPSFPLLDLPSASRVVDLAQPLYVGAPHWPTHPPFTFSLTRLHGDMVLPGGGSAAADAISMGTHVGTHIDGLGHFSCCGKFHGGAPVDGNQSYAEGVAVHPIGAVAPIVRRGVLLDIAALEGVEVLPEDFVVTPEHLEAALEGLRIGAGDVVLIRTGWAKYWHEPRRFMNELRLPGPRRAGAEWLSARGVFAAGSDTAAFEFSPSPAMEAHIHLLVERGIHIIECLNLEALAAERIREFLFAAAPLKIRGATGSPIRPFALCAGR